MLAPTGIGKTEFAYLWSNGEKMFYTLPLRTATNQIFERTQKIFGNDNVGLLHSDADLKIFEQSYSDHLKYDTESFRNMSSHINYHYQPSSQRAINFSLMLYDHLYMKEFLLNLLILV